MKDLKPVTFIKGKYSFNRQNTTQQIMLLKALEVTSDPNKLREMIGVKTVAEVYRTLDKMALRKEFQDAFVRQGLSFDYILSGIKNMAETGFKDSDKLKALQILLKSLGMDKYEEKQIVGGSWEDELLRVMETQKAEEVKQIATTVDYVVVEPEIPESVRKIKEKENSEGKSLYE